MCSFSIIMPTYNCEKYVASAIKSILNQTYSSFELLIVDDGSTDNSVNIIKEYAMHDPRIRFFANEHKGVSYQRNCGIENAKNGFVIFVDGDDTWCSSLLEVCASTIKEFNRSEIVFGIQEDYYDDNNTIVKTVNSTESSLESVASYDIDAGLFARFNMASPCNKVYSLNVLNKYKVRFSEKNVFLEDLKFNCDYYHHINKVVVVNRDLYYYRLEIDKNQILKRQFNNPFENADNLYDSVNSFVLQKHRKPCSLVSPFREICLEAYLKECYCLLNNDYSVHVLSNLNTNQRFCELLDNSKSKQMRILFMLKKLRLYFLQFRFLRWRYKQ